MRKYGWVRQVSQCLLLRTSSRLNLGYIGRPVSLKNDLVRTIDLLREFEFRVARPFSSRSVAGALAHGGCTVHTSSDYSGDIQLDNLDL